MGKKKKGLKKRINPEKSNKMIYAVGVGVLFLFLMGVMFVLNEDEKKKEDPVISAINELKDSEKIIDVKIDKNNPTLINIIIKEKDKKVMRLIKTEAIDLSYAKRKTEYEFIISVEKLENKVYSLKVNDGKISNFKSIKNRSKDKNKAEQK